VTKRISKLVWILLAVKTARHFLQVRGKMLRADFAPRSQTAALQVYPDCFSIGLGSKRYEGEEGEAQRLSPLRLYAELDPFAGAPGPLR
jgi:hypothetical protein